VIYAAFSVYLLGVIFAGQGVYRLWADMIKPRRHLIGKFVRLPDYAA